MNLRTLRPKLDSLGELETSVLEILWDASEALSVREVGSALRRRPALAYTTVMTVLDRLHDKGFVARDKSGRAFLYRPRIGREELLGERAVAALSPKGPPPNAVLVAFLDSVESRDPALLDTLADLIAARRSSK
ncbi:MAG: BlaI/MecI/CopY family transcriptional regulator [Polyangiaceae bacterium]|nr:BlaI/MecI/CopY family transcriptional regulator [Polyangiaceae bacterium]